MFCVGDVIEVVRADFKLRKPFYAKIIEIVGGQDDLRLQILAGGYRIGVKWLTIGHRFYLPSIPRTTSSLHLRVVPDGEDADEVCAAIAREVLLGDE